MVRLEDLKVGDEIETRVSRGIVVEIHPKTDSFPATVCFEKTHHFSWDAGEYVPLIASIKAISTTIERITKHVPKSPQNKKCRCEIRALMAFGCKCGGS